MQTYSRIRSPLALTFLGLAGLVIAGEARLEADPMPTIGTGTCTGAAGGATMLTGTTNIAIDQVPLLQTGGAVFGRAECECRSRDITMNIRMTATVPMAAAGVSANMWVGQNDCTDLTRRSLSNYQCEQITAASPPGNGGFNLEGDATQFKKIEPMYIPIPAESLVNPLPVGSTGWPWSCDVSGTQNRTVSILIGPDPNMASCQLPVTVMMDPPATPSSVGLSAGDGALAVSWTVVAGTTGIQYYQLLCRKTAQPDRSAMPSDFLANTRHWFSACVNGTLHRRPLPGIDSNKVVSSGVAPWEAGVADGGVTDGGTAAGTFPLDPKFICSDRINPSGDSLSARITGLDNYQDYEVAVVAIDTYGNGAASVSVVGQPRPTESPLQPFCDANNGVCPTGFGCQMAGAPVGAGALALLGLGSGLLFSRQRRRRQARHAQEPGRAA